MTCSNTFAVYHLTADLFKLFEPLIGKKSIQYANGPEGRKRRQLMDRSFSHEAVTDYYEHFVRVCGSFIVGEPRPRNERFVHPSPQKRFDSGSLLFDNS